MSYPKQQILFEPWNMGDALIATAIALQAPQVLSLACNSRWHALIKSVAAGDPCPQLIPVDLEYVNRQRNGRIDLGPLPAFDQSIPVVTIRGDIRDYFAAKRIFSHSSIRSSGWYSFAARRSVLLDFPFAHQLLRVRNRYRAWSSIVGLNWTSVEKFYAQKRISTSAPVVSIHIGAQWRSKMYPHVANLAELLSKSAKVQIIGGLNDQLPPGVSEREVRRLVDQSLVEAFLASNLVIANDSGPMHLAAILRCNVACISRMSSLAEWLPPSTIEIRSESTPFGYRPDARYMSDEIVSGWPTAADIVRRINPQLIGL